MPKEYLADIRGSDDICDEGGEVRFLWPEI
jgi:hypothetical protein